MNYIKSLQEEVKFLKEKESDTLTEISNLYRYLNSDKFRAGPNDNGLAGYVSIKDIQTRLAEISTTLQTNFTR